MTHMMEQQQLAVRDTSHAYLESRANAVDAVQGTIAELGNIFQVRGRGRGRGRGRVGLGVGLGLGLGRRAPSRNWATSSTSYAYPQPLPHPRSSVC